MGKSFFMGQLACHVAMGLPLWNYPVRKGTVLYLALEDDYARLIIIDTLQKVREVGGNRYGYSSDYEIVTKLKSFSDKYGVCLLVVYHTRKLESEDSFDMISGTKVLLIERSLSKGLLRLLSVTFGRVTKPCACRRSLPDKGEREIY